MENLKVVQLPSIPSHSPVGVRENGDGKSFELATMLAETESVARECGKGMQARRFGFKILGKILGTCENDQLQGTELGA